jgi:hypothetical protein
MKFKPFNAEIKCINHRVYIKFISFDGKEQNCQMNLMSFYKTIEEWEKTIDKTGIKINPKFLLPPEHNPS